MQIKKHIQTINKSKGINTKEYLIVHHTATKEGSINGVLNRLSISKGLTAVSCHYVVDVNGDIYKIGEDSDILWHAGISSWGNKWGMNKYSIGIEVIGPLSNGFNFEQKKSVRIILEELRKKYKIPKQNILRHADLTQLNGNSGKMILWDGKGLSRKVDIDIRFLNDSSGNKKYSSWKEYQDSIL